MKGLEQSIALYHRSSSIINLLKKQIKTTVLAENGNFAVFLSWDVKIGRKQKMARTVKKLVCKTSVSEKISNFVPKTHTKYEDMAYPFGPARREVFKKTFLRHVLLHISFTPVGGVEDFADQLNRFVSERFKKVIGEDEQKEEVGLISDDKTVGFIFSREKTVLSLQYPGYKNFEMVLHLFPYLTDYVKAMGVKSPLTVSIIKFNELEFKIPKGKPDIDSAMRAIFSKELLGDAVFNNGDSRCEKNKYFDDEDSNSHIRLTYGFKLDDMDSSKGSLVLKSTITKALPELDSITDENLHALNDLLDGAFQWCVKEEVLTNMRQG